MITLVNGPPRSGTGFMSGAWARRRNMRVLDYSLYWSPPFSDESDPHRLARVYEDDRIIKSGKVDPHSGLVIDWERVTWDEVLNDGPGVVHAHIALGGILENPSMLEDMLLVYRHPRNMLVSAANRWFEGDLLACLKGRLAGNPYALWMRSIMDVYQAVKNTAIKYEEITEPGYQKSDTIWEHHWTKEVDDEWEASGMAMAQERLGYSEILN